MDIWTLAMFLDDIVPDMEVIDGHIFLDRNRVGLRALTSEVDNYSDRWEAQKWINMVPVDDFLNEIVDEFDPSITDIEAIRVIYERSWRKSANQCGFKGNDITVEVLKDKDTGDLIFRLCQIYDQAT
jgi:hypothetical protein